MAQVLATTILRTVVTTAASAETFLREATAHRTRAHWCWPTPIVCVIVLAWGWWALSLPRGARRRSSYLDIDGREITSLETASRDAFRSGIPLEHMPPGRSPPRSSPPRTAGSCAITAWTCCAVARAALTNAREASVVRGASTITPAAGPRAVSEPRADAGGARRARSPSRSCSSSLLQARRSSRRTSTPCISARERGRRGAGRRRRRAPPVRQEPRVAPARRDRAARRVDPGAEPHLRRIAGAAPEPARPRPRRRWSATARRARPRRSAAMTREPTRPAQRRWRPRRGSWSSCATRSPVAAARRSAA